MGCASAIAGGAAAAITVKTSKSKQQKKEEQLEKNGNMRTRVESSHHRKLVKAHEALCKATPHSRGNWSCCIFRAQTCHDGAKLQITMWW